MKADPKFRKLMEPGYIGKVKTRNRIIKTGASMLYWHESETSMNQDTLAFYEAVARGGVGLLIVESPILDYPIGARWRERYRMDDDKYIKGMSELTSVIHKHGCPVFMQMEHDGPWQSPLFPNQPATFDGPPVAASPVNLPVPGEFHRDVPRELTVEEIEEITEKCINAAVRAQKAGFDGVDINSGSSHLFHNFLSPFWNRRQDAYGGTVEKRAKLVVDLIKGIKKRNGSDFAVSICLSGIEIGQAVDIPNNDCLTHEDVKKATLLFQEAGADSIHIRSHWLGYHVGGFLPEQLFFPEFPVQLKDVPKEYNVSNYGKGANMYFSESLKKILSIPIIVVGRIEADLGESILRKGNADFIAMHRPMMADPEYPNKVFSGRLNEAAPCTKCGTCLDQSKEMHRRCRINAAMGTDKYTIDKAEKKKKVVVIGAGPSGMEAARVSALRGHDVTLFEKSGKLGGLLPVAALVKGLEIEDLPLIIRYFKVQLNKLGVNIKLGKEADRETIEKMKPDAVVFAGGGIVSAPDLPGVNNRNVITAPALHKRLKFYLRFFSPGLLRWLTNFYLPVGKNVVVIGSDMHGLEIAEFLIKRGRNVTIVDTAEEPGKDLLDYRIGLMFPWLEKNNVEMINKLKSIEITKKGVTIVTEHEEKRNIEADSVIPVIPSKPNTALSESLKGKVPEIYSVGDCKDPALIVDAIRTGWTTAKNI